MGSGDGTGELEALGTGDGTAEPTSEGTAVGTGTLPVDGDRGEQTEGSGTLIPEEENDANTRGPDAE